ncbi:MAG: polyphosphate kinase 2 [Minicystis sp.]
MADKKGAQELAENGSAPEEAAAAAETDEERKERKRRKKLVKKEAKDERKRVVEEQAWAERKALAETPKAEKREPLSTKEYKRELKRLQVEFVKLQYWVKHKGLRVVLIFEGRDAAGKGGMIKRITEGLNPRGCRVVALATPSDREQTQWYFQRYVAHLPAAGEIVIFDRSWYNRAGVERVMGFCTDAEYHEFMRACPEFEGMLVRSGIVLLKYWFSVSDDEQERRFRARLKDPMKRWKFSPMDVQSRDKWVEYSKAKDEMLLHTNIPEAPWFTVESDDKERARLNCMRHILVKVPYEDLALDTMELTPRKPAGSYARPPKTEQFYVPRYY